MSDGRDLRKSAHLSGKFMREYTEYEQSLPPFLPNIDSLPSAPQNTLKKNVKRRNNEIKMIMINGEFFSSYLQNIALVVEENNPHQKNKFLRSIFLHVDETQKDSVTILASELKPG